MINPPDELRDEEKEFIKSFTDLSSQVHNWAICKGFWVEGEDRNDGEIIALIHSELSEALEAVRKGNPPDEKLPNFDSYTTELADCIIRIMDVTAARKMPIAEAIVSKIRFNQGRPYKHGKEF